MMMRVMLLAALATCCSLAQSLGKELWFHHLPAAYGAPRPAYIGRHVFVFDMNATLHKFELHRGRQIWSRHTRFSQENYGAPAAVVTGDSTVAVAGVSPIGTFFIAVFDAETGKDLWSEFFNPRVSVSLDLILWSAGYYIVPGSSDDTRVVLERSGLQVARLPLATFGTTTNNTVALLNVSDSGYSAQGFTLSGELLWTLTSETATDCPPMLAVANLFVLSCGGETIAVHSQSGEIVWSVPTIGFYTVPVIVGDTVVLFSTNFRNVTAACALAASSGTTLWNVSSVGVNASDVQNVVATGGYVGALCQLYENSDYALAILSVETGKITTFSVIPHSPQVTYVSGLQGQFVVPTLNGVLGFRGATGLMTFNTSVDVPWLLSTQNDVAVVVGAAGVTAIHV